MAARNRSFHYLSSSPAIDELEEEAPMKQGIVTILSSDSEKTTFPSLRKTLSADMSSKKWLAQNGFFSPSRKTASFDESAAPVDDSSSSSSDSDEGETEGSRGAGEFWASVLSQTERKPIQETGEKDVWGSIMAQKNVSSIYVHPLEKKSAIRMSDRSLEMCTECIGSETGSDGFCSEMTYSDEDLVVFKSKKSTAALLFPPPLSSICCGDGAALVHIQPHRMDGRLILAAVPVPSRNRVRAHRQDGRLILTLISRQERTREMEENEVCGVVDDVHDVEVVDHDRSKATMDGLLAVEKVRVQLVGVHSPNSLPTGVISMHKSSLTMALSHREMDLMEALEPPPRVARMIPSKSSPTTLFNVFNYLFQMGEFSHDGFFDLMITTIMQSTPWNGNHNGSYAKGTKEHELVLALGRKQEFFVPYLKGCKESRRPLLMREPCCIATT